MAQPFLYQFLCGPIQLYYGAFRKQCARSARTVHPVQAVGPSPNYHDACMMLALLHHLATGLDMELSLFCGLHRFCRLRQTKLLAVHYSSTCTEPSMTYLGHPRQTAIHWCDRTSFQGQTPCCDILSQIQLFVPEVVL